MTELQKQRKGSLSISLFLSLSLSRCWLIPQIVATAGTEPHQSQEPGPPCGSPTQKAAAQTLDPHSAASPDN